MWACAGGHADAVKLLLTNGADVKIRKHDGKCAGDIAAYKKHYQVTVCLNFFNLTMNCSECFVDIKLVVCSYVLLCCFSMYAYALSCILVFLSCCFRVFSKLSQPLFFV